MRKLLLTVALTLPTLMMGGGLAGNAQEVAPAVISDAPAALPTLPNEGTVEPTPAPAVSDAIVPQAPAIVTDSAVVVPTSEVAIEPAPTSAHPGGHADLLEIVLSAHWVVLWVMAGLAAAAFVTLVILLQKMVEFAAAFRSMGRVAKHLNKAQTLADAADHIGKAKGPAAQMVRAAAAELDLARAQPALLPGVRERTHASLVRIDAGAAQRLRGGTGILASIGSLSPFVGLFGTVFGIMNSFLAIAETKTTNLAVVAPGIAEALFATAIGLAAAIPAVLIYNICSRRLAKYRHRLADVAAATELLQSRALDLLKAQLDGQSDRAYSPSPLRGGN